MLRKRPETSRQEAVETTFDVIKEALKSCFLVNAPLLYKAASRVPFVVLKYAMTLDSIHSIPLVDETSAIDATLTPYETNFRFFYKTWDPKGSFSNFSPHPLQMPDGNGGYLTQPSVEHYYQTLKYIGKGKWLTNFCKTGEGNKKTFASLKMEQLPFSPTITKLEDALQENYAVGSMEGAQFEEEETEESENRDKLKREDVRAMGSFVKRVKTQPRKRKKKTMEEGFTETGLHHKQKNASEVIDQYNLETSSA